MFFYTDSNFWRNKDTAVPYSIAIEKCNRKQGQKVVYNNLS